MKKLALLYILAISVPVAMLILVRHYYHHYFLFVVPVVLIYVFFVAKYFQQLKNNLKDREQGGN